MKSHFLLLPLALSSIQAAAAESVWSQQSSVSYCEAKDLSRKKLFDITIDWGTVVRTNEGEVIIHETFNQPAHITVSSRAADVNWVRAFDVNFSSDFQSTRCGQIRIRFAELGSFATIGFESGELCGIINDSYLTVAPNTDKQTTYQLECSQPVD